MNIRRYTQREILEEGFWKNLRKNARWGIKAAAKALDYVAPELTKPIHKLEAAGRDILGMKPADSKTFQQNLNAAGGTVEFKGKQYLIDLGKGVTPIRNGRYVMKANEVNPSGKKSNKVVSLEMDKDFNVYGVR